MFLPDSLKRVVSVDTVCCRPVADELTLTGRVAFNPEKVAQVYPIFGGTVVEVRAEIGDYVRQGDVLAVIRSGEVAEYEKQRKESQHRLALVRRNLHSVQDMAASGMASEKDVMQARKEVGEAEAEAERLAEVFSIYHVSGGANYQVKAPLSGFVVEKHVNPEEQLRSDDGEEMFTISGLENVWVMADVYESDISKVGEGDSVRITTLAYPEDVIAGKIDKVYNMLDEESKTMSVRVKLDNRDYKLKPGMFTQVRVCGRGTGKERLCVPSHALVFENGRYYVVTVASDDRLAVKEVEVYLHSDEVCYLSSGLTAGERILNRNVLLVYNALNAG